MVTATFVDVWDQVDQSVSNQIEDQTGKRILIWIKNQVEDPIRNQVSNHFEVSDHLRELE